VDFSDVGFEGLVPKGTALAPERKVGPTDPAEFELIELTATRGRKLPL
jgi:hypothetical protein